MLMRYEMLRVLAVAVLACCGVAASGQGADERPRITGISHVGFFVSDLPKAEAFWHDFLGFDEAYALKKPASGEKGISFIKINDRQHIELFNETPPMAHNMLSHLCFSVGSIEQMRQFLRSKGYDLKGPAARTRAGDLAFEIKDPDGVLIEFVQSLPDGWEAQAAGKAMPEGRISARIYHVGYIVSDAEKTMAFYKMLGFTETWRGGSNPQEISWINLKVPDGDDYVELMLFRSFPPVGDWGVRNHVSLMVPDVAKAVATLRARPYFGSYGRTMEVRTGVNQKRQVNLFDPDGTRVELMEPVTVTGKPTPPSTAPLPPGSAPWVK